VHTTKGEIIDLKGLLARDADFVRAAVAALVQAALEAEMTEAIGAAKGRTQRDPAVMPQRLLQPLADHPGRQLGIAGASGTGWGGSQPNCSSAISVRRRR
jgi:hypothetical protein